MEMNFSYDDVKYAAEECRRQRSGEMSVLWMLEALAYARRVGITASNLTEDHVDAIGTLVEPKQNQFGFRRTPVIVKGNLITHKNIEAGIVQLCGFNWDENPDRFYYEFQIIHPFIDGNGRTGSILWNAINGTLASPYAPPDMFGDNDDDR